MGPSPDWTASTSCESPSSPRHLLTHSHTHSLLHPSTPPLPRLYSAVITSFSTQRETKTDLSASSSCNSLSSNFSSLVFLLILFCLLLLLPILNKLSVFPMNCGRGTWWVVTVGSVSELTSPVHATKKKLQRNAVSRQTFCDCLACDLKCARRHLLHWSLLWLINRHLLPSFPPIYWDKDNGPNKQPC